MDSIRTPTSTEEIANSLTHGAGLALSIVGLVALVVLTSWRGTALHIVSCTVYGISLVAVYLSSTIYHGVRGDRPKQLWRVVDHCAIFLLIAGTYTPFTLVAMGGGWGWSLFGVVWAIAMVGILFKLRSAGRYKIVSGLLYLAMGWLVVVAIGPLVDAVPPAGIAWLVAGGLSYTAGVGFYAMSRVPYAHTVWHLFVLAGSTCHYVAVLSYVVPW